MIICPVKIEPCDSLPKNICDECLETVLSAYKLRNVSNNAERYLRSSNKEAQAIKNFDDQQTVEEETQETFQVHESTEAPEIDLDDEILIEVTETLEIDAKDHEIIKNEGFMANAETPDIDYCEEVTIEETEDPEIDVQNELIIKNEGSFIDDDEAPETDYFEETMDPSSYTVIDPNFKYKVYCQYKTKKTSAVWSYIGALVDENCKIVEEEKECYFCKICVEQKQSLRPRYKASSTATSVLFAHLMKVHGIIKSEMVLDNVSSPGNSSHHVQEMVGCEVCKKTFYKGSFPIHKQIEHRNGALGRTCEKYNSPYKVNCFKMSLRSRSLAWDYFGALENENGEKIDQYYFYCRLCVEEDGNLNPKYTKHTSTSILLQHLKNFHIPKTPEELAKRKLPEPIMSESSKRRVKEIDLSCKFCGENFEEKKILNQHLSREHNEELTCPIGDCSKDFTKYEALILHVKRAHNGDKFSCARCPAVLATQNSLQRHIESCHFKLKYFHCDKCSATLSDRRNLKNHIQKIHMKISEKKVQCLICQMKFPNNWSLRRHTLTHTGEKPHGCHICSVAYATKADLTNHLANVHNAAYYQCEFYGCTESFRLKSELRDHYSKIHYEIRQKETEPQHENEEFEDQYEGLNIEYQCLDK